MSSSEKRSAANNLYYRLHALWERERPKVPQWDSPPSLHIPLGIVWNQIPSATIGYTDRFIAFLCGTQHGVRYFRSIVANGEECRSGKAADAILQELCLFTIFGSDYGIPVSDGGDLPFPDQLPRFPEK